MKSTVDLIDASLTIEHTILDCLPRFPKSKQVARITQKQLQEFDAWSVPILVFSRDENTGERASGCWHLERIERRERKGRFDSFGDLTVVYSFREW